MTNMKKVDMTKGRTMPLILKFTVPMLAGNLFQQMYNMVDSAIVGKFVGPNALAAVGTTGSISWLFFSLVFGFASGIGIIIAQYHGAKDEEMVKKTIATGGYIMLGSSLIMAAITILLARPVMLLLNTPEEIIEGSILYLRVVGIGVLAIGSYECISSILRALGDSVTPLIFLVVACFVNIGLDLLFVVVFKWGILGVALATIIAQASAAIGAVICGFRSKPIFRMPLREYVINREIGKKIISIGVPVAMQSSLIAFSCIVLQRVVNGFGPTIMAAYTVVGRVEQLVQQPFNSLSMAIGTYTGQNIGAGNIKRVSKGFWCGAKISIAYSLIMLPVALLGGEWIIGIFTSDPEVIFEGARGIRINCFFYSFLGLIYVTRSILNGSGDVKFTMFSGVVEVMCRVGFAGPLTLVPGIGMLSIWFTSGFTWTLTAIVSCIHYGRGKWKNKGLIKRTQLEGIMIEK